MTADRIVLTIPHDEGFENVAQLVLAGVAARLNFTYEVVDDLGTALETLLERRGEEGEREYGETQVLWAPDRVATQSPNSAMRGSRFACSNRRRRKGHGMTTVGLRTNSGA